MGFNNINTIDINRCPVCKSMNIKKIYRSNIDLKKMTFSYAKTPDCNKTFRVVRCQNCTHVFCSPIPKNIHKNYEEVIDYSYLKYSESLNISARLILPIIKSYIPSGLLLDVGCATGDFLIEARNTGYHVEGLELSRWSSKIAKKRGIIIYRERLRSLANRFSSRYEIVTLFGVIEHFENPVEEVRYIEKLLKPGGLLVIWTGDVDSLISRTLGRRWWYWQGQHIQYFTYKSLNYLTKLCGFKFVDKKNYPFVATYDLMDNYLGRYYSRPWIMKIIRPLFIVKPIWTFRLPGEILWLGRKKMFSYKV